MLSYVPKLWVSQIKSKSCIFFLIIKESVSLSCSFQAVGFYGKERARL